MEMNLLLVGRAEAIKDVSASGNGLQRSTVLLSGDQRKSADEVGAERVASRPRTIERTGRKQRRRISPYVHTKYHRHVLGATERRFRMPQLNGSEERSRLTQADRRRYYKG